MGGIDRCGKRHPGIAVVFSLSSVGDVIHALPAAHALRKRYPGSELTWIAKDKAGDLVRGNPFLDRVIIFPNKGQLRGNPLRTLRAYGRFFRELRGLNCDFAVDLAGTPEGGLITRLCSAKKRLGPAGGPKAAALFYHERVAVPPDRVHIIDKRLYMAQVLGADAGVIDFGLTIPEEVKIKTGCLMRASGVSPRAKKAVINPFTTWKSKNWLNERWAELADRLAGELGYEVIFTGSLPDRAGIGRIINLMKNRAHNWGGKTSLKELAGLYGGIDLFIGGDTGPMHLAAAMGVKTVALMGPTLAKTHGPCGSSGAVVQKNLECIGCWKKSCPLRTGDCMKQISVEDVMGAIRRSFPGNRDADRAGMQRMDPGNPAGHC